MQCFDDTGHDAVVLAESIMHLLHENDPQPDSANPPVNPVNPATPAPHVKALNEKAMTVQLVTRKPQTTKRDQVATETIQSTLGDNGLAANKTLFKDSTNPVRQLLNESAAVYQYHIGHTLPYKDRGARLLPAVTYESYRDSARKLAGDVDARVMAFRNNPALYDAAVQQDILYRNRPNLNGVSANRASVADYPTLTEFLDAFSVDFIFEPLPDNSHWLFDIDPEDKVALQVNMMDAYNTAVGDLRSRIEEPLKELLTTLRTPVGKNSEGKRTGIFRDTKVTNLTDAVNQARALCMDDPAITALCDTVAAALPKTIVDNIDILRESPVVREAQAKRLEEVSSKMAAFFS